MSLAVPFPCEFEPIRRTLAIDTGLPATDANGDPLEWVTSAYHGFVRNTEAPSQTNAKIAFRRLGDGEVHEEVLRTLPAAAVGLMPIGSVWRENHSDRQAVFETQEFDVDYDPGKWSFNSFSAADSRLPYPRKYPSSYDSADRIHYLELNLRGTDRLVIPCAEYFTRMYGVSHYLRQVLLGYPWVAEGDPSNRLYGELRVPTEPNAWAVRLRPRLDDRDAIFLAHAKYDPFTTQSAKSAYAQLESGFKSDDPDTPITIEIGPWHRGKAKLEVQGFSFDDRRSFLGLRIVGCSIPDGAPIHVDRDNSNLAERAAAAENGGKAWRSSRSKATPSSELTGKDEPDHGSAIIDVAAPHMTIMGSDRPLTKIVVEQAEGSAGAPRQGGESDDTVSSGEAHGADKGVSHASISTPRLLGAGDIVDMMWKAALSLHERFPAFVSKVEWYTVDDRYRTDPEPRLIAVPEFERDAGGVSSIPPSIRAWPYLNVAERTPRGVLVMRLTVLGQSIHMIEIQRRRTAPAEEGTTATKREAFCGLAVRFDDDDDLPEWLSEFLTVLRYRKGIVHRTLELVGDPGYAKWYPHRLTEDEYVPGERALLNGLRHHDLRLPPRSQER